MYYKIFKIIYLKKIKLYKFNKILIFFKNKSKLNNNSNLYISNILNLIGKYYYIYLTKNKITMNIIEDKFKLKIV